MTSADPRTLSHQKNGDVAFREPGDLKVEYKIKTPDGDTRWIEVRGRTTFDSHGEPISMSGVSIDITARRQAEEQRTLLARELNHRVKISLAMVQSIFGQTLRSASSMEEARTVVAAPIQALADAQDVLIDQGWTRSEMQHVVASAMRPFQDTTGRIRFSGPRVVLSATAATALSLAFHELATNAVKYGALSNASGSVTIRWQAEGETFSLTWKESGGPQVAQPTRRGFGTSMIEKALAASVAGSAKIHYANDGLAFSRATSLDGLKPVEKL